MNFEKEKIFDFNGDYKLAKCPPKEDGYYITIRCGLGGIYTHLDEYKDGKWQLGIADDSNVIAYQRNPLPREEVNKWFKAKLEQYRAKLRNK